MDTRTSRFLNQLNASFYGTCASSFSDTRAAAWPGWRACLGPVLAACGNGGAEPRTLLDLACGNLRFEAFLADALDGGKLRVCAVDSCEPLVRAGAEAFGLPLTAGQASCPRSGSPLAIEYHPHDVAAALLDGEPLGFSGFDVAVCFGFFHHVPSASARIRLLDELVSAVLPGGVVAISLWRLLSDERLARKADEATRRARDVLADGLDWSALETGDRLLGWQEREDVFRYAHSFSDAEIDELAASVGGRAEAIMRFRADGRGGDLNEYLVFHTAE